MGVYPDEMTEGWKDRLLPCLDRAIEVRMCLFRRAADFPNARDDQGAVYVSDPRGGTITRCTDPDGDGALDRRTTFVADRPTAHGMQWHDDWPWFTQTGAIQWARDTDGDGALLIGDGFGKRIFRLTYAGAEAAQPASSPAR